MKGASVPSHSASVCFRGSRRSEATSVPRPVALRMSIAPRKSSPATLNASKANGWWIQIRWRFSDIYDFTVKCFMTKRIWFRRWIPSGLESSPKREPAINSLRFQGAGVLEHTNAGGASALGFLWGAVGLIYVDSEDFYIYIEEEAPWTSHQLKDSRRERNDCSD